MLPHDPLGGAGTVENTQSFLVRVWLERREAPGASSLFRGWVQHLQTGEKTAVSRADEIGPWIADRLRDMPGDGAG